jgi:hypothetical protein
MFSWYGDKFLSLTRKTWMKFVWGTVLLGALAGIVAGMAGNDPLAADKPLPRHASATIVSRSCPTQTMTPGLVAFAQSSAVISQETSTEIESP